MKLRHWHLITIFCLLIIVIKNQLLYNTCKLFYYWASGILSGDAPTLTIEVTDYFISAAAVFILPLTAFLLRKKIKLLNSYPGLSLSLIFILLLSALLAPLVSTFNPEFQKNISVTKLLPPLSMKYFLTPSKSESETYSSLRIKVLQEITGELQIADSVSMSGAFFQGGRKILFTQEASDYDINSRIYIFGTDELGRDIFSRIIYGTRISLTVGFLSVLIAFFIGLTGGFFAGYYEGWGGDTLNRITDMFLSFPSIFLIILILALFGNSVATVIIVLGFSSWMPLFKIIRGEVKSLKLKDYFITASAIGLSRRALIFKEMMPVVIAPVISNLVLLFSGVIVAEASLSYLGLGTGVMHPSWGSMIEQGQNYIGSAWWMIIMPGLFLFATIFSANNIGKQIQFHFNPRIK